MPDMFGELYDPGSFIDFAKGYYARVFKALDYRSYQEVAFKILRPKHLKPQAITCEYTAFGLEADLLQHWEHLDKVVHMQDCGFVSGKGERITDGQIVSLGKDVAAFNNQLASYNQQSWRPYLCVELMPPTDNLLVLLREHDHRARRRLPTEEGLDLALQYADLLRQAHADDIVYLDVKLEHFYWNGRRLQIIDWNSSRMLRDKRSKDEDPVTLKKQDIRNFVVGLMYPIFTGMPAEGQMFVEMPSNQQAVTERYQTVRDLDFGMEPTLDKSLVEIMRAGAQWKYADIQAFLNDLHACAGRHGWEIGERLPPVSSHESRQHVRAGLAELRTAQRAIERARQAFLDAIEHDGASQEIKRLKELTEEFLSYRVIP